MFTVCPKCALTLVVTAADLRVAQGYVRCGRCSSVFNALARLSERQAAEVAEADPAPAGAAPAQSLTSQAPATATAAQVDAPAPAPDDPGTQAGRAPEGLPDESDIPDTALEFNAETTDVNSVFVAAPPNPQWTAATGSFRALVDANQDGAPESDPQVDVEIDAAFLASMLRGEASAPQGQTAAPTVPGSAARAAVVRGAPGIPVEAARRARILEDANVAALAAASTSSTSPAAPRLRSLTEEQAIQEAQALAVDDQTLPAGDEEPASLPHPLARFMPYAWPAGAALAAVLLIAQVINHYRDDLAASARFNHPLTAIYGSLGIHLFPHWDLRAYDVRQLGASGDPAGAGLITVRASIKNGASQAQPLPLLRVTLQDRFGNRIAARDVAPTAYLPAAMPASSFLSAGQRIDAQMGFADPGPNAVGFEIDACLPASAGVITCANDSALR
jgi:predicted Zn finger-like uncharacterized protein